MVKISCREGAIRSLVQVDARGAAHLKNFGALVKGAVSLAQENRNCTFYRVHGCQVWYSIPVEVCRDGCCWLVAGGEGRTGCLGEILRVRWRAEGGGSQNEIAIAGVLKRHGACHYRRMIRITHDRRCQ